MAPDCGSGVLPSGPFTVSSAFKRSASSATSLSQSPVLYGRGEALAIRRIGAGLPPCSRLGTLAPRDAGADGRTGKILVKLPRLTALAIVVGCAVLAPFAPVRAQAA